jgi:hypothetical protein
METPHEACSAEGRLHNSLDCDSSRFASLSSRCHAAVVVLSTVVAASNAIIDARGGSTTPVVIHQTGEGVINPAPRSVGAVKIGQTVAPLRLSARRRWQAAKGGIHHSTTTPGAMPGAAQTPLNAGLTSSGNYGDVMNAAIINRGGVVRAALDRPRRLRSMTVSATATNACGHSAVRLTGGIRLSRHVPQPASSIHNQNTNSPAAVRLR